MLPDSILIDEVERGWKEVMSHFNHFTEALGRFQQIAPDMSLDYLGPELQLVYQLGLQRKKPVWVIEHLEMELTQKGDLSHLTPREPEPEEPAEVAEQPDEEQTQPSEEPPLEPEGGSEEGDDSDSPKKDSAARKGGRT